MAAMAVCSGNSDGNYILKAQLLLSDFEERCRSLSLNYLQIFILELKKVIDKFGTVIRVWNQGLIRWLAKPGSHQNALRRWLRLRYTNRMCLDRLSAEHL